MTLLQHQYDVHVQYYLASLYYMIGNGYLSVDMPFTGDILCPVQWMCTVQFSVQCTHLYIVTVHQRRTWTKEVSSVPLELP